MDWIQASLLSASVYIGIGTSCFVAGRIADRYGYKKMLPLGIATLMISMGLLFPMKAIPLGLSPT